SESCSTDAADTVRSKVTAGLACSGLGSSQNGSTLDGVDSNGGGPAVPHRSSGGAGSPAVTDQRSRSGASPPAASDPTDRRVAGDAGLPGCCRWRSDDIRLVSSQACHRHYSPADGLELSVSGGEQSNAIATGRASPGASSGRVR